MKYCVVIIDGASGRPLPERRGKTCLELADTPNLDRMAREGRLGLAQTVPPGMEPTSACACMSIMGYDPKVYYKGRSPIEAVSMGIPVTEGEVSFRCNLVAVQDGRMLDYSAGHINDSDSKALIEAIQEQLGNESIHFYHGISYRHICKLKGQDDTLRATCTPPHDISGKPVKDFLPHGPGSDILLDLMERSVAVLRDHPVNKARKSRGDTPATMIWLFWGSGRVPDLPPFKQMYGIDAALTSGVDLLRGLAKMASIETLHIEGVTDGPDNDYSGQAAGALKALDTHDIVFIHIEAPDEAGHSGLIDDKVKAIERADREVVGRLMSAYRGGLRILSMPDHATPIEVQTHTADPVPFAIWGAGFQSTGARAFNEKEAGRTGIRIEDGYVIMKEFAGG